jgi:AcrR family transcriptional regulator
MTGTREGVRPSTGAIGPATPGAPLSGAALRREQGRREMRAAILDEARRLLTEEGASALSMRAIARALGYSPAALYEYFPSKEDIFAALYFEGTEGLAGQLLAVRESMPADRSIQATLSKMGRAYRAYAQEHPELFRLVFGDSARHGQRPSNDLGERPGFDDLVAAIENGIATGEIDGPAAEPIAVTCWAVVHGFVVLEIAGFLDAHAEGSGDDGADAGPACVVRGGRPDPDQLFEMVLDRLLVGVLARTSDGR